MVYLLLGIGLILLAYLLAAQAGRLTGRAVKMAVFATLFIVAAIILVVFALSGRYGLAAPAGAFALWAMRAWLLARQIRASGASQQGDTPSVGKDKMSVAEALEVLGLEAGASPEEIETAYKNLIVKNHPDSGGSNWLAARLNEARAVLLDD